MRIKTLLSLCCYLAAITYLNAQNNLEQILWSSKTYEQIVEEGGAYFKKKYPNLALSKLAGGENRDSEYVKFMR